MSVDQVMIPEFKAKPNAKKRTSPAAADDTKEKAPKKRKAGRPVGSRNKTKMTNDYEAPKKAKAKITARCTAFFETAECWKRWSITRVRGGMSGEDNALILDMNNAADTSVMTIQYSEILGRRVSKSPMLTVPEEYLKARMQMKALPNGAGGKSDWYKLSINACLSTAIMALMKAINYPIECPELEQVVNKKSETRAMIMKNLLKKTKSNKANRRMASDLIISACNGGMSTMFTADDVYFKKNRNDMKIDPDSKGGKFLGRLQFAMSQFASFALEKDGEIEDIVTKYEEAQVEAGKEEFDNDKRRSVALAAIGFRLETQVMDIIDEVVESEPEEHGESNVWWFAKYDAFFAHVSSERAMKLKAEVEKYVNSRHNIGVLMSVNSMSIGAEEEARLRDTNVYKSNPSRMPTSAMRSAAAFLNHIEQEGYVRLSNGKYVKEDKAKRGYYTIDDELDMSAFMRDASVFDSMVASVDRTKQMDRIGGTAWTPVQSMKTLIDKGLVYSFNDGTYIQGDGIFTHQDHGDTYFDEEGKEHKLDNVQIMPMCMRSFDLPFRELSDELCQFGSRNYLEKHCPNFFNRILNFQWKDDSETWDSFACSYRAIVDGRGAFKVLPPAIINHGNPGTGKSVWSEVLLHGIMPDIDISLIIGGSAQNNFYLGKLESNALWMVAEAASGEGDQKSPLDNDPATFKHLTGEKRISTTMKGKDAENVSTRPGIINANHHFAVTDRRIQQGIDSVAFMRRIAYFDWTKTPSAKDKDKSLAEKIIDEEAGHIFIWMVMRSKERIGNLEFGHKGKNKSLDFSYEVNLESDAQKAWKLTYSHAMCPIGQFIQEVCLHTSTNLLTRVEDIISGYVEYKKFKRTQIKATDVKLMLELGGFAVLDRTTCRVCECVSPTAATCDGIVGQENHYFGGKNVDTNSFVRGMKVPAKFHGRDSHLVTRISKNDPDYCEAEPIIDPAKMYDTINKNLNAKEEEEFIARVAARMNDDDMDDDEM